MIIKLRYIAIAIIVVLFSIFHFFSSRVNVYYDNPKKPLKIYFSVNSTKGNNINREIKILDSGSVSFGIPRPISWAYDYYGTLTWWEINKNQKKSLTMLGESNQPDFHSCKIDVYLDEQGNLISFKETDYKFLNLCW